MKLNPSKKILSGVAMNLSGKVSNDDLAYIKDRAKRRAGSIQTVSFVDQCSNSESVFVFEYYGEAKGLKLVRYYLRKFLAAAARYLKLGDVFVSVVIRGNALSAFPVHGAGKPFDGGSDSGHIGMA